MSSDAELWHLVEAKRDDGMPTLFRIRDVAPNRDLDRIFVVELPYPTTEALARLPNATSYRRLADLEEQWVRPACSSLGCEYVATKTEDGSFFLYMYGNCELNDLIAKLSPFDGGLGFYDDVDPDWQEYGTLRELLDQAQSLGTKGVKQATDTTTKTAKAAKATKTSKPRPAAKKHAAAKRAAKPKARATSKR